MQKIKKFIASRPRLVKELAVVILPIAALLFLVQHYAVNVPVTDQYEIIRLLQEVDAGTLSFGDLWAQHNEHRIFFPKTIQVGMALVTNWSIKAEIISSVIVGLAGFTALFLLLRRLAFSMPARLFVMGLASLWFFSPVQWENWLWGWQLEWFLCIAAMLWALYLLTRVKPGSGISWTIGGAALLAFVATFSLGSGMMIWVMGMSVLLLRRMKKLEYIFWGAASALTIGLYFIGYKSPQGNNSLSTTLHEPIEFLRAYLAYLGRPVAADAYPAILAGSMMLIIVVILLIVLYKKRLLQEYAVWVSMILGVFLVAAATVSSRLMYGIFAGLGSRYTAFSLLLYIAVGVILVGLVTKPGLIVSKTISLRVVLVTLGALAIPAVAGSYYNGLLGMKVRSAEYRKIYVCSRELNPTYECLYMIYFPSVEVAKERLDYLKQKGYGGY